MLSSTQRPLARSGSGISILQPGLPKVVSSDEAKAMLKRRNGLMELYDFYVASVAQPATVSWGGLNGRLAGPCNLVAHEGHRPSAWRKRRRRSRSPLLSSVRSHP